MLSGLRHHVMFSHCRFHSCWCTEGAKRQVFRFQLSRQTQRRVNYTGKPDPEPKPAEPPKAIEAPPEQSGSLFKFFLETVSW